MPASLSMFSRIASASLLMLILSLGVSAWSAESHAAAAALANSDSVYAWPLVFEGVPIHTEPTHLLTVFADELIATNVSSMQDYGGIKFVGRWDGANWRPMGKIDLAVHAFTTFDGRLVAGGTPLPVRPGAGPLALWTGTRRFRSHPADRTTGSELAIPRPYCRADQPVVRCLDSPGPQRTSRRGDHRPICEAYRSPGGVFQQPARSRAAPGQACGRR